MPDVFADLVGQDEAVVELRRAAAAAAAVLRAAAADRAPALLAARPVSGDEPEAAAVPGGPDVSTGMTHAWIFTGPPGSGRSVAARAFAAALQCVHGTGCGECPGCRQIFDSELGQTQY